LNNRLSAVGGGGYRGAFLLGLVCGLVAAPCVGPFLFGLLGWIATTKNVALGTGAMAFYALGLGTLFFVVGTFAVNLPKAGAWMMGVKWVGGVCLAYMALAYVRDALPRGAVRGVVLPTPFYGGVAASVLFVGLVLGGTHVTAERRKSPIAHLSQKANHHLDRLVDSGLVAARKEGKFVYHTADYRALRALTDFLWEDCCKRGKGLAKGCC
jgi:thiol:disulfide interchange protein DsbD